MVAWNCRHFILFYSMRRSHWLEGSTVRPEVCPQLVVGTTVGLMSVVIFLSPWDRSYFGVVLASVSAAGPLSGCGTLLDRLWSRMYQRVQVCRRTWDMWCQQKPMLVAIGGDLLLSGKTPVEARRFRGGKCT